MTFGIDYLADAPWLWSVLILIIAAIASMITHLWQSQRKHHFRDKVPSPWFYIGNLQNYTALKWPRKTAKCAIEAFHMDFKGNYEYMAKEDLAGAFEKDVEQLVILYTILAYKEKNVELTTKVIEGGLVVFIALLIVLFVWKFVMP